MPIPRGSRVLWRGGSATSGEQEDPSAAFQNGQVRKKVADRLGGGSASLRQHGSS